MKMLGTSQPIQIQCAVHGIAFANPTVVRQCVRILCHINVAASLCVQCIYSVVAEMFIDILLGSICS